MALDGWDALCYDNQLRTVEKSSHTLSTAITIGLRIDNPCAQRIGA